MSASVSKKKDSTVLWWIGWILLTIVSFFVSCAFWTGFIAQRVGSMQNPQTAILWVTTVFGSWMVLLVPLIVVMYQKVDKAYEDARTVREKEAYLNTKKAMGVKSIFIEDSARLLNKDLIQKLKKSPETIRKGHLVTATLDDGRKIENVFVYNQKDVLGIYGLEKLSFDIRQIVNVEPSQDIPNFKAEEWLRLDGVGGPPPDGGETEGEV